MAGLDLTSKQFLGSPCVKCGSRVRTKSSGDCLPCAVARTKRWREQNPEKRREQSRLAAANAYRRDKVPRLMSSKAWKERNKEHLAAYQDKRREHHRRVAAEYRKANADAVAARNREWQRNNPGIYKKRLRQQMPAWVDRKAVTEIYRKARELGMSVDHVVPLRGRLVSGLHVVANLQIIPLPDNRAKSNKWIAP